MNTLQRETNTLSAAASKMFLPYGDKMEVSRYLFRTGRAKFFPEPSEVWLFIFNPAVTRGRIVKVTVWSIIHISFADNFHNSLQIKFLDNIWNEGQHCFFHCFKVEIMHQNHTVWHYTYASEKKGPGTKKNSVDCYDIVYHFFTPRTAIFLCSV